MNYWCIFLIFVPIGIFVFGRTLDMVYPEGKSVMRYLTYDILGIGGFESYNITWWFNKLILTLYIISPLVSLFARISPLGLLILIFIATQLKLFNGSYWLGVYFLPFAIGLIWAQNSEKVEHLIRKTPQWIGITVSVILVFATSYCRIHHIIMDGLKWDTYVAVAIILLVVALGPTLKYIRAVFAFMGKHSMNIYLMHTFVYNYFWGNQIKALGNPWIMLGVVTIMTLVFSMILESIKDKLHFYKFQDKLIFKATLLNSKHNSQSI